MSSSLLADLAYGHPFIFVGIAIAVATLGYWILYKLGILQEVKKADE